MKLPRFIVAFLERCSHREIEIGGEVFFVEPNDRGGFSIRGHLTSFGNYPTAEDAMRVVRLNGDTPRLRLEPPAPASSEGVLKYVVMQDTGGSERILFCVVPFTHFDLAVAFQHRNGLRAVSAGFVEFTAAGARAFGRSESLNLGARPGDSRLIGAFYRATAISAPDRKPFKPSHGLTHQSTHA